MQHILHSSLAKFFALILGQYHGDVVLVNAELLPPLPLLLLGLFITLVTIVDDITSVGFVEASRLRNAEGCPPSRPLL